MMGRAYLYYNRKVLKCRLIEAIISQETSLLVGKMTVDEMSADKMSCGQRTPFGGLELARVQFWPPKIQPTCKFNQKN